ncbi:unnamed protein product [Rangifer tarandus platyrhynchus]|uniref:Uncharacterized protein n=1 Tax=Rangifer tarandus platyrhynchus TaxID=3082113 RepID=A0ABN9A5L5_RANTA|nr:unnamed protein product [Rangifer tarandus platyrhynchus]CAI9181600.1 unnamed protein product [Rangifer tarandus platyrhynchus]
MVSAAGTCAHVRHRKPSTWGSAAEPSGRVKNALQTGTGGQRWASARERRHRRGACPPLGHFPASWALFCPTFEERAELLGSSWPTRSRAALTDLPCIGV